ncbi:uncharacterized protein LOC143890184 isoform X3 [Tasmannia lanceolata]|uniref:uncharacterized protein LOC143890184 isoform X3 n=1 Tax=Tasmannia lanceolata TaxID=3420 RepID=UPI0040635B02
MKEMTQSWVDNVNMPSTSTSSSSSQHVLPQYLPSSTSRHGSGNVFRLLALREISPRTKRSSKRLWGEASKWSVDCIGPKCEATDARHGLISWLEAESLRHLSAKYSPLLPPPRSTIAAAFSPDGKAIASTHGDHTVKIIDCQTGSCVKVLSGHRRTPWVVRFHPVHPEILASGSLDHEVRLWDANTAECIGSRDFYRPIASIAFHAQGELLAVASGHKLYIWHYNKRGETSSPTIVLKTRRSLRAVHFHPHAAPFLLTAEVNDLDSPDSPITLATSLGYLNYPPPAVLFANETPERHPGGGIRQSSSPGIVENSDNANNIPPHIFQSNGVSPRIPIGQSGPPSNLSGNTDPQMLLRSVEVGQLHQFFSFGDPACWELPFLQGWLMGQTHAGLHPVLSLNDGPQENSFGMRGAGSELLSTDLLATLNVEIPLASAVMATGFSQSRGTGRSGSRHRSRSRLMGTAESGEGATFINIANGVSDPQPGVGRIESELAKSLAAGSSAELPCTVKLRIWPHNIQDPCAPLDADTCRLTVPHAVLCSEMGAHFSPCGRFLAACVACVFPRMEADPGLQSQVHHDATGLSTSPTRHPISAHQIMYELRIYSLEESSFGLVLASRAIRAAHCLTSIQFSPTSEHILLAYGRRHSSLLRSIVIDGDTTVPIYTILEVYRVSDMELVRVLPNAEDEVNVACFHPSVGGGLVYGTKEGKLRILQYDGNYGMNCTIPNIFLEENMLEVPAYALEC